MTSTVPRIVPLGDQAVHTADGTRFALLHVVSGERHHLGWFELGDDDWRVGLTSAGAVVDAGVAPEEVRGATEDLLGRLRGRWTPTRSMCRRPSGRSSTGSATWSTAAGRWSASSRSCARSDAPGDRPWH